MFVKNHDTALSCIRPTSGARRALKPVNFAYLLNDIQDCCYLIGDYRQEHFKWKDTKFKIDWPHLWTLWHQLQRRVKYISLSHPTSHIKVKSDRQPLDFFTDLSEITQHLLSCVNKILMLEDVGLFVLLALYNLFSLSLFFYSFLGRGGTMG